MKIKIFALSLIIFAFGCIATEPKKELPLAPDVTPVEKYTPPTLSDENSWTMVVIPDTQAYVARRRSQGALDMMFCWIAENVENMKIQQVVQLGDMVDVSRQMITGSNGNYQTDILENGKFYKVAYVYEYLIGISGFVDDAILQFADIALENVEIGEDSR